MAVHTAKRLRYDEESAPRHHPRRTLVSSVDKTAAKIKGPFRNPNNGHYCSLYVYGKLVRSERAPLKNASGKRIRVIRADFIAYAERQRNVKKEHKRSKGVYAKRKREKAIGHKIAPAAPVPVEVVGPRGGIILEPPKGELESYVRYSWLVKDKNESESATYSDNGAVVLDGKFSLEEILNYTNPQGFYRGWNMVKPRIISGELTIQPESGVHYQQQTRDASNMVWPLPGSEQRLNGSEMLRL